MAIAVLDRLVGARVAGYTVDDNGLTILFDDGRSLFLSPQKPTTVVEP